MNENYLTFPVQTKYGLTSTQLPVEAYEALIDEGGISPHSYSILIAASQLLEYSVRHRTTSLTELASFISHGESDRPTVTMRRALVALRRAGLLRAEGSGPATAYLPTVNAPQEHTKKGIDTMSEQLNFHTFIAQHPAKSLHGVPFGMNMRTEEVFNFPLQAHSALIGEPGSGKTEAQRLIIRQLIPSVHEGLVRIFALDPKGTAFEPEEAAGVLAARATTTKEVVDVISKVAAGIDKAASELPAGLGDPCETSNVLVIDDYGLVMRALENEPETIARLEMLFNLGRPLGVRVIASIQSGEKQTMYRLLDNVSTVALFGQNSAYLNDRGLGVGATERGDDSRDLMGVRGFCFINTGTEVSIVGIGSTAELDSFYAAL